MLQEIPFQVVEQAQSFLFATFLKCSLGRGESVSGEYKWVANMVNR